MTNQFYGEGRERATKVGRLFETIAARYDLLNDIQSAGLHRLWKRRLVSLADLKPGDPALDVCCGTGDIAIRLGRLGAEVIGVDFSEPMLAVARQRVQQLRERPAVEFRRSDAMHLPFADSRFAAVTVGYGLRNLEDWRVGLTEMARVARPGGRILVLDFGKPANPVLRGAFFLYLRIMVPLVGLLFCGNAAAYSYILESLRHYPAQSGIAKHMRTMGLKAVRIHNLLGGMMSINHGMKP